MPDIVSPYFGNRPRVKRWAFRATNCLTFIVGLALATSIICWNANKSRSEPVDEIEIFEGVRYGCHILPHTGEGEGPMHWVRVDLTAPGIGLYVTPTDQALESSGYQYRLQSVEAVVETEHLAVAINGSMFRKGPYSIPGYWRGQRANGIETVISDGRVSRYWEHTYLLWFDAELKPTLERHKPPRETVLSLARWGIGGQSIGLWEGKISHSLESMVDKRTAIGTDERKRLYLAVFQSASPKRAMQEMAAIGARNAMLLDGGGSSALVLGTGSSGVAPGAVLGGLRPVATHFGIRARRITP